MHAETARLVAEAEAKAERLVAVIRMVVAIALGVIFALQVVPLMAALGDMIRARVAFAGISLAAYFIFGMVSYRIARSRRYRAWMSWVFAALDVAYILFNLYHNLRNTGLPPEYMSSFVAIWLAPLILAFGALRYSPFLQGFVTLGLLGGVVYLAVRSGLDPQAPIAPPLEALPGLFETPPNAIRLTILALAGFVLIVAAARTRTLLRHAVEETRRRANLTRYLPPQIAAWLADTGLEEIQGGQRQTVAILFADIRGFTARAQSMPAAELTRFIGEFRACVTAAADAHNGVIDKFVGDSAMVIFGVPEPGSRDARDALDCARAILDNVAAWRARLVKAGQAPVEIGVGVHCGEVFCGAVGDSARLEFTVLGDPVNVAARIEQQTKSAGYPLLVSRAVLDAADASTDDGRWAALPQQTLRGHQGSIDLFGAGGRAMPPPAP